MHDGRAHAAPGASTAIIAYVTAAFGDGAEGRVRAELGDRGIDDDRAVWGDPDGIAAAVVRFAAVGIDGVVLVPAEGEPDLAEFLGAVGEVARLVA